MVKIYSYQKTSDQFTQYRVQGEGLTELCEIDGTTYVSTAGDLPAHSPLLTVTEVDMTDALRDQIKAASPHVQLINERIKARIRDQYDAEDEMYFARISIGAIIGQYTMEPGEAARVAEYGVYVESVRQWGRDQRAELGL
jgi:hypothetical protein